jgi:hypothetical protein
MLSAVTPLLKYLLPAVVGIIGITLLRLKYLISKIANLEAQLAQAKYAKEVAPLESALQKVETNVAKDRAILDGLESGNSGPGNS